MSNLYVTFEGLFTFFKFFISGGITPIDWDTECAIFEGTFLAEK